jgi:hypothetical protein
MAKKSAGQEASCVIDWGMRRENLLKESQAVCDRVLEECLVVQRWTQTAGPELSIADAEAASRRVIRDARCALGQGRRAFLAVSRRCTAACWQWTHPGCRRRAEWSSGSTMPAGGWTGCHGFRGTPAPSGLRASSCSAAPPLRT